jgi:hypothetical protein
MAQIVSLDSNQTIEEQQQALQAAYDDGYEKVNEVVTKAKRNKVPGRRTPTDTLLSDEPLDVVHVIMEKKSSLI